ncbi:Membrane bound FAD containing D-sorbitol dehydrogenase [Sphingobium sp. AP50]|uniref:sugar dehydrogenase complex small subunit n=1 Tax=Sphingobium sp. AP50 TaxID=1884369 RepID=UPI0008C381F0|nr:sugar dehydrogenase complex small subunit [Sphingobium sp. AP50]SEK00920.1 Membrane bound FAD containing D-sorbitol dehydrogenase [Sphingobium sp. AP50]
MVEKRVAVGKALISRRNFVVGLTFALPVALRSATDMASAFADVTATAPPPSNFMAISRLLTGHPEIADDLGPLAWSALVRRDKGFAAAFTRLADAIGSEKLTELAQYPQSRIAQDPALKATAVDIVSAWYLGVVGQVTPYTEGADFITYTGALMWRPTYDVTVIPSYSRAGPGFWGEKPASLATD